jgi:hypothetical protein
MVVFSFPNMEYGERVKSVTAALRKAKLAAEVQVDLSARRALERAARGMMGQALAGDEHGSGGRLERCADGPARPGSRGACSRRRGQRGYAAPHRPAASEQRRPATGPVRRTNLVNNSCFPLRTRRIGDEAGTKRPIGRVDMYYRILRIILAVAVASPLGAALPAAAQQQPQQQQNQQGGMPGMDHSRMGDHSAMGPGIGQQMMQQHAPGQQGTQQRQQAPAGQPGQPGGGQQRR